ncbi:MAG: nitrile hydratase subunit alpha [Magnetovibrio sp.]|nr:nitrile hydratase subunit alpha [Magnetovibrio sp.]
MVKKEPLHPHQRDLEDTPFTHYQIMTTAITELLFQKNIFSPDDLRAQLEAIDRKGPADGARLIARAWVDPDFKERMKTSVNSAATELGLDPGNIPILAVENTPELHNVIVCTLCSCYPRMLIGLPPDWYKSRSYRARVVREPRTVLKEFGTEISDKVEIRVHDSTADLRYMVIPMKPDCTESMDESALAKLVTRDTMIGVTLAKVPD